MRNFFALNADMALDSGVPAGGGGRAWLGLFRRGTRGAALASARLSLETCDWLLQLLAHLQQHRGMSSAYLSGNSEFGGRMLAKRKEIEANFLALRKAAEAECEHACPCFTLHDLTVFRFKWRSLVEGLDALSGEQSMAEHSALIATALAWLDALGEARIGLPLADRLPAGLVRIYAHRLPALSECLGQARAIGSGVAAQGKCSAVARVRLLFLVSRAESLLDQSGGIEGGDAARAAVRKLAELVRSRMVASQNIDVDAARYFSQATEAIDAVFAWIGDCGQVLHRRLCEPGGGR